jgi:hypothetical protein
MALRETAFKEDLATLMYLGAPDAGGRNVLHEEAKMNSAIETCGEGIGRPSKMMAKGQAENWHGGARRSVARPRNLCKMLDITLTVIWITMLASLADLVLTTSFVMDSRNMGHDSLDDFDETELSTHTLRIAPVQEAEKLKRRLDVSFGPASRSPGKQLRTILVTIAVTMLTHQADVMGVMMLMAKDGITVYGQRSNFDAKRTPSRNLWSAPAIGAEEWRHRLDIGVRWTKARSEFTEIGNRCSEIWAKGLAATAQGVLRSRATPTPRRRELNCWSPSTRKEDTRRSRPVHMVSAKRGRLPIELVLMTIARSPSFTWFGRRRGVPRPYDRLGAVSRDQRAPQARTSRPKPIGELIHAETSARLQQRAKVAARQPWREFIFGPWHSRRERIMF